MIENGPLRYLPIGESGIPSCRKKAGDAASRRAKSVSALKEKPEGKHGRSRSYLYQYLDGSSLVIFSEYQRLKIKEALPAAAANIPRALTVASIDTSEANGYAAELMIALNLAGLKIQTGATHGMIAPSGVMKSIGTGVRGIFFQVKNPKSPPGEVIMMKKALEAANIKVAILPNPDFPELDYALTVANP